MHKELMIPIEILNILYKIEIELEYGKMILLINQYWGIGQFIKMKLLFYNCASTVGSNLYFSTLREKTNWLIFPQTEMGYCAV